MSETPTRERPTRWTRAQAVAVARTWIGTPCMHGARVKGLGCDCGGLPFGVARELGLNPAEPPGYPRFFDPAILTAALAPFCDEVPREPVLPAGLAPADILVLEFSAQPMHCAIFTERETIIHAWDSVGKVCETPLDRAWQMRVVSVWRCRELAP